MTQIIIDTGAANDGTGESLRDAFQAVNDNFSNVWAAGPVDSQVVIANNKVSTNVTNLDLKLAGNGTGNITVHSSVMPSIDGVYDLGSSSVRFADVHGEYFHGDGRFITGITTTTDKILLGNSNVTVNPNNTVTIGIDGIANIVSFTTTTTEFAGNIVPTANNVYSLGSNIAAWKDIYVSGNTIYLGSATLTSSNGNLYIGGVPVATGNATVPGANTQVVFNESGSFGATAAFTFNSTGNVLSVAGTVTAASVVGGVITGDSTSVTGTVTAASVVGGVITGTSTSVTGAVIATTFQGDGALLTKVMTDRGSDHNDWNTITQMGTYTVNRMSWSGTVGAPLDSQVFIGLLEVKNSTDMAIVQIYSPGTVDDPNNVKIQWNRNYWDGSWTYWVRMTNNQQEVDGGAY